VPAEALLRRSSLDANQLMDLATGERIVPDGGNLALPRYRCLWLSTGRSA
jgi:hypothetical protein